MLLLVLTPLLAVCGADGGVGPDETVGPFVGNWDARRFVVTNKANPAQAPDLIADLNASFTINIQPSGLYTAVLVYQGTPLTEIGTLDVVGNEIVFNVQTGEAQTSRSTFTLAGSILTLIGDTEFDYDGDGTPETAVANIELVKR